MAIIVLRLHKSIARDSIPVSTLTHEPDELSLNLEDPSPKELLNLQRDPQLVGTAPPLPVQLIQSFDSPEDEAVPSVSWGLIAVGAARSGLTGTGITVAVLDTGIDPAWKTLPTFASVDITTKNFTMAPDEDVNGHGTHCATTVFGRPTTGCQIGVAPGIERALIGKVIGDSGDSTDAVFKAILWAFENGAQVISMSIGMDFPAYREQLALPLPDKLATSKALAGYRANVHEEFAAWLEDEVTEVWEFRKLREALPGEPPGVERITAAVKDKK